LFFSYNFKEKIELNIKELITTFIVTMAAPVIKLEPIRMGDLLKKTSSSGYLPPHLRVGSAKEEVAIVGNNATSFPALGTLQEKNMSAWKQVIYKAPVEPSITEPPVEAISTMNDKIKSLIRQSELEELARQKPREEDPEKMTREELLEDGWVFLSLKDANEARLRLNSL